MKIKLKIFLLFILFVYLSRYEVIAQNKMVDSLIQVFKTSVHDTDKVNTLIKIADEIYTSDPDSAFTVCEKALVISKKCSFQRGLGASYAWLGVLYDNNGDFSKGLYNYNKSLEIMKALGNKIEIANQLNNIGTIYFKQGIIEKSLENYISSLKIQEEIKDLVGAAYSLSNIGSIYMNQNDFEKAFENYNKCLKFFEEINDRTAVAQCLNNIGMIYRNQNNNTKALEYFLKSLKINEELGNKSLIGSSLINIGLMYDRGKETDKAFDCYTRSLAICMSIGDKYGIANSLNSLSGIYLGKKDYNKALKYSLKAMEIAKQIGFTEIIKHAGLQLSKIYEEKGDYKNALQNYELFILMRDSVNNLKLRKASIKSEFKYAYEKKAAQDSVAHAKESEIKNAELEKQKIEIKAKRSQQYALSGGLFLVIMFAGLMFNRFKVTQKQKTIIELKEQETQRQNLIITEQKLLVEEKQKEVLESIHYAKRIQTALIPSEKYIDKNLKRLKNLN